MMKKATVLCAVLVLVFSSMLLAEIVTPAEGTRMDYRIHDWERPRPAIVTPGAANAEPPSDAIVLFDGSDLSNWCATNGQESKWIIRDGYMESVKGAGYIRTKQGFGDCQLHVEFRAPLPVKGTSQGRGNSGVFLMGKYEIQVLDSYDNITYADGQCSALYGQHPPQVNVCRKPGEWQSYDIIFTAPKFCAETGELVSPAFVTVFQNGVLTHYHQELMGPTNWCSRTPYSWHPSKLPLAFQDHGNPVRYRNVWVRELPATGKPDSYRKEMYLGDVVLEKYAGTYKQGNRTVEFTKKGDVLIASWPGDKPRPIYAESETRFYSKFVNGEFEFVVGKDGVPTAVKISVTNGGWGEFEKVK